RVCPYEQAASGDVIGVGRLGELVDRAAQGTVPRIEEIVAVAPTGEPNRVWPRFEHDGGPDRGDGWIRARLLDTPRETRGLDERVVVEQEDPFGAGLDGECDSEIGRVREAV